MRDLADVHLRDVRFVDIRIHLHLGQILRDLKHLRRGETGGHGLPGIHLAGDHNAIDGRGDAGVFQVQLGLFQAALGLPDLGFGRRFLDFGGIPRFLHFVDGGLRDVCLRIARFPVGDSDIVGRLGAFELVIRDNRAGRQPLLPVGRDLGSPFAGQGLRGQRLLAVGRGLRSADIGLGLLHGRLRRCQRRLGAVQRGLGLVHSLLEWQRVDFGQELPLLHLAVEVRVEGCHHARNLTA